jgi:hypothetical protein
LCGLAQCGHGELVVGERCEGNEVCQFGDVGHDETVEVVEYCSGDDLAEWSVVAAVCALQSSQAWIRVVSAPLILLEGSMSAPRALWASQRAALVALSRGLSTRDAVTVL